MKVKIEIEKITEWEEEDTSYEKIADSGNKLDDGPAYGYVHTGKMKKHRNAQIIYRQEVEVEGLSHIIASINGLREVETT